jgi:transcriptional regulator with XRE-family HTH domain
MASFSERMTELRLEKGLSKAEVARGTKMSRSAITSYENGSRNNPTNDILKKLSEFFDVSLDYLTGQSDIRDKLTATELIEIFRRLNDKSKLELIKYAKYLEKEQSNGEHISS